MPAVKPAFHLSLAVHSLDQSVDFYVRVLNATVAHRDPGGYVNLELFGAQLTLQPVAEAAIPTDFHFGFNLAMDDFERLAENILASGYDVAMQPKVVDAGTPLERKKMYVRCPSGYLIELKGYAPEA
ncbi:MAG TPA: VOC family protein [Thermoanaerobaculia bacterium]|nr:VOC family protein [Thermoanaerobaculia bacterium]